MKPAPLRASAPRARVAGSRAAAGSSAGTRHLALKSSMRSADALCKPALGDLRTTPPPPEGKWGFQVARCAGEPLNMDGASPADTAATFRELEHALRNELFALTLRIDLAGEEVARRRDELNRRLAHTRELLARSEALV